MCQHADSQALLLLERHTPALISRRHLGQVDSVVVIPRIDCANPNCAQAATSVGTTSGDEVEDDWTVGDGAEAGEAEHEA